MPESKVELYYVHLLYHPSGDHMDSSADIREEFFTLSTSASEASNKVIVNVKSKRGYTGHYDNWAVWKGLPKDITPEQGLSVLKAAGLRVVE